MTQMQSFIEKAKNDKELMAKLDALGASGAGVEEAIALAAEYGFLVTEEDCRQAAARSCPHKKGELAEEDLATAAGGATQNRYDPVRCGQATRTMYECVGFLKATWCDHYREQFAGRVSNYYGERWHYYCAMGCYDYIGVPEGGRLE